MALARFWVAAAGWRIERADEHLAGLRSPAGVGPYLEFLRVPGQKAVKNRWHPDVAPQRDGDVASELARLRAAGATPAGAGPNQLPWTVLADPEGNEFCMLAPR